MDCLFLVNSFPHINSQNEYGESFQSNPKVVDRF